MNPTRLRHSLNGAWRLVLDPHDVGIRQTWFSGEGLPEAVAVRVPAVWDLWVPDYDGVGWYFREFEIGPEWEGRHAEVRFEAADYFAEVWLNGARLGEHEGGYTPFAVSAAGALRTGPNLLAVRIVDPHGENGYKDFLPKQIPCAKEGGYFSFAGLWGGVELIGNPPAHIADVFVLPDIRRKRITVDVTVADAPGALHDAAVRVTIEGTPCVAEGPPGRLLVEFPDHELWSPESPTLYELTCELLDGEGGGAKEVVDRIGVRFGMREFTVKDGRFCLNNRPVFVKGVLHQPDYPRTLAAPESEAMARRELELAKAAGFNLIRLHIKTAPELTLRLCDEIGLMAYEEPPIGWIEKSEWMKERCEREVREMILRDRNHPSVVIWGMLNESGNAGYVVHGGAQDIKDDLCALARSLDPSRVIVDDSGGVNATREYARVMRPYHDALEPYDDLHIYQRAPVDQEIELYYRNSGEPDRLCFLSEFGFGGIEDLADVVDQYPRHAGDEDEAETKDARFLRQMLDRAREGFADRGLERIFDDFAGFTAAARELQCDAARFQVDACRANPKVAGYCYTQLCDAGHEVCAGVLDHWRRPKPVLETLKRVQERLRPLIILPRTNLEPRQEVPVSIVLINEDRLEGRADLSLQVVGPTSQVLWKKKRNVKLPRTGKEIWDGTISASGSTGVHRFVVRLMQGTRILAQNDVELHVFARPEPSQVTVQIVDPHREWQAPCAALAEVGDHAAAVHVVPPLANTIRAYPAEQLAQVLAQTHHGAAAVFFSPPPDWNDLAQRIDPDIQATSKDAVGGFLGMYHYVRLHPVFDGLPMRCLMRQPYRNVVAPRTFVERGEEDICGTFDTTPIASGHYMIGEAPWWGSDILVRRFGSGRIVFAHLRVLEHLGEDPLADRLFVNMLKHFGRRSIPPDEPVASDQRAVDWLKRERLERTRRWMVLGMFPNWEEAGHDTAYPPEDTIDLKAVYPGWYKPIAWRRWYSQADHKHLVNLQDALTPVFEYYPRFDYGTAYAYAEFTCHQRHAATLNVSVQDATKVWLNGRLVFEDRSHRPHKELEECTVPVTIRQGRNTVLVKVSKIPGEFQFALDFALPADDPAQLTWWR